MESSVFVRLNEDKLLAWLICKVEKVYAASVSPSSVIPQSELLLNQSSSRTLKTESSEHQRTVEDESSFNKGAHIASVDIVNDYLSIDGHKKLLYTHYGLQQPKSQKQATHEQFFNANTQQVTQSFGEEMKKKVKKDEKEMPLTAGQKRLRKIDTSKNAKIQAFFKAPKDKEINDFFKPKKAKTEEKEKKE